MGKTSSKVGALIEVFNGANSSKVKIQRE